MSATQPGWQEAFLRESGIRRALILHGNAVDLTPAPGGGGRLVNMPTAITQLLRQRGYRHVVCWDRVSGVSGVDQRTWQGLMEHGVPAAAAPEGTEAYDAGIETPPVASQAFPQEIKAEPRDVLTVITRCMQRPPQEPVAFLLDWTQYLFGNANALSEEERGWLVRMGKAARDADERQSAEDSVRLRPLMVLLCQGVSVLPPSLYLNNPLFKDINLPLPSRQTRADCLRAQIPLLDIEPMLVDGSRELEDLVDALDGMTLRDIQNLVRLSRQTRPRMSASALLNLYRYGERTSPWEALNRDKLAQAAETLGRRVKGQDQAIAAVNQVMIRAFTGLSGLQHSHRQRTPKGVLFFVGPTGVGKTELAKSLAEFLFGDEEACLRFDMSEFNHEHADQRLVGAPPGYVGYEAGGQLTNAVKQRPFSLLLFDEIEKAHPRILDKFLQILEDGRLTDGKGETMQFSDTFIVFTSNIGASRIKPETDDVATAFISEVRTHFINELKRPELLGRIGEDNIIPFNFMRDENFLVDIARTKLEPLRRRLLEKWGITGLHFRDETNALQSIVSRVDRSSGGRGVLNALTLALFDPLARFLFEEVGSPDASKGRAIQVIKVGAEGRFDFHLE